MRCRSARVSDAWNANERESGRVCRYEREIASESKKIEGNENRHRSLGTADEKKRFGGWPPRGGRAMVERKGEDRN